MNITWVHVMFHCCQCCSKYCWHNKV